MARPALTDIPAWYRGYTSLVKENDLLTALRKQTPELTRFFSRIPVAKRSYRYAKGKWSVRELLQHIIDAERIFCYRALCFARQDKTPLPGFDENSYAANAKTAKRDWKDLINEWKAVRQATILLFDSFDKQQLSSTGTANNNPVSVLAIGFIVAGHAMHHVNILSERYLRS